MRTISAQELVFAEIQGRERYVDLARVSFTVRIAGVVMRLFCDDADVSHHLERRYRDHRCEESPDFDYYVVRDGEHVVFFGPGGVELSWPHFRLSAEAVAFLADAAAMSALIRSSDRIVSYHAAAVERDGRAAAIVAESNGGKTTTSLACARIGMRVYSDERLLLAGELVQPFLRACNVRPDGRKRLLADDAFDALARALPLAAPGDLSFIDVFGRDIAAPPAPLHALFVIAPGGHGAARAEPIASYAALPALTRWADASCDRLTRAARTNWFLKHVACYKLTLGTPRETAACIDEILRRR